MPRESWFAPRVCLRLLPFTFRTLITPSFEYSPPPLSRLIFARPAYDVDALLVTILFIISILRCRHVRRPVYIPFRRFSDAAALSADAAAGDTRLLYASMPPLFAAIRC